MNLTELLSSLPFYQETEDIQHINIKAIETDHRNIEEGDLFICIKGFTVDGHEFAEKAVANGARAILSERELSCHVPVIIVEDTTRALSLLASKYFKYPTEQLSLIGITGTNGKTTITYILEEIFKKHHKKTGIIGTIQMKIGDVSYPVKNTTPDALSLQKSFREMINEQVDVAMMEVSSHALALGRVHGCAFDIAVFTNLSQDHLDFHHDMEDYFQAKSLLFSQLGNAYTENQRKFSIINIDDEYGRKLKGYTAQHILTYGVENDASVMARQIKMDIFQTTFTLETPIGEITINSPLIGMFNVYNMLAAATVAIAKHVPLSTIKEALEDIQGVAGRFERVDAGQKFAVIVDYAHTPDSLENVLQTIQDFASQKIYVVVGCGGDRDKTKRPLMADISLQYADHAIFTSDNPRTEEPAAIIDDMTKGLSQDHYEVIENRKEAINHVIELAEEGDIILIAGKGHETYQEINHVRYDFDDREVAKQAIVRKGNK